VSNFLQTGRHSKLNQIQLSRQTLPHMNRLAKTWFPQVANHGKAA